MRFQTIWTSNATDGASSDERTYFQVWWFRISDKFHAGNCWTQARWTSKGMLFNIWYVLICRKPDCDVFQSKLLLILNIIKIDIDQHHNVQVGTWMPGEGSKFTRNYTGKVQWWNIMMDWTMMVRDLAMAMAIMKIFDKHTRAYLIFVIFFTLAKFLENKIYTEKRQFFALNL